MGKAAKQEPGDGMAPRFPLQTAAGPLGTVGAEAENDLAGTVDERRGTARAGREGLPGSDGTAAPARTAAISAGRSARCSVRKSEWPPLFRDGPRRTRPDGPAAGLRTEREDRGDGGQGNGKSRNKDDADQLNCCDIPSVCSHDVPHTRARRPQPPPAGMVLLLSEI